MPEASFSRREPRGIKVLYIEDNAENRMLARAVLEADGYTMLDAPDGRAGLRMHATQPADLIITDLFMPDYDGIETILELRRTDPTAKVVAVSGGGFGGSLDLSADARSLGALRTFRKPLNGQEVLEAVREILGPGGTG